MHEGSGIVTPQRWQSLITHVEEKVEDHYWDADGLNTELLEQFIIDIGSDDSNDNISDGGENVGSMKESDSAEDVCSITLCHILISYLYRSKFALEYHLATRWCYLITSRYILTFFTFIYCAYMSVVKVWGMQ